MQIVLLGAPGSGKGTQAQCLERDLALPQVSTGDLLRRAVSEGTELGLSAKAAMDAGELVSDHIVLGMIKQRLEDSDAASGYILDGFPRNVEQAKGLAGVLRDLGKHLDAAVLMDVDFEVLMKRLTGRRTCSKTGKLLNIYFSPQEELDACIDAGGELLQRDDDNEDTIRNRLDVYERETQPLIGYYREREVLQVVNADGCVEDVYARLREALGTLRTSGPI